MRRDGRDDATTLGLKNMCYPSGGGGGGGGADPYTEAANRRQAQIDRENSINRGNAAIDKQFQPFNDQYYADFEKKYLDQATPDIARQKQEANTQTLYGLARSGNLDSSTAGKQYGDIEYRNTQALQNASDTAHNAANDLKSSVEAEKNDLRNQLNAAENATISSDALLNGASTLRARTPQYSPITGIFSDITGALAANEQARSLGKPGLGFGFRPMSDDPFGNRRSVEQLG